MIAFCEEVDLGDSVFLAVIRMLRDVLHRLGVSHRRNGLRPSRTDMLPKVSNQATGR